MMTQPSPVFEKALTGLINAHSIDAYCSVPDYILARYIICTLEAQRDLLITYWTGHDPGEAFETNFGGA